MSISVYVLSLYIFSSNSYYIVNVMFDVVNLFFFFFYSEENEILVEVVVEMDRVDVLF